MIAGATQRRTPAEKNAKISNDDSVEGGEASHPVSKNPGSYLTNSLLRILPDSGSISTYQPDQVFAAMLGPSQRIST